jgi:hypothetical protein
MNYYFIQIKSHKKLIPSDSNTAITSNHFKVMAALTMYQTGGLH